MKPTPGSTQVQIGRMLEEIGITPKPIIVEWSTNWADYPTTSQALSAVTKSLPPKENGLRAIPMWHRVVPGFVTFALQLALDLFFPKEAKTLSNHHRVKVDTYKLLKMVQLLATYLEHHGLQKRTLPEARDKR